jgi:hypothetical protein
MSRRPRGQQTTTHQTRRAWAEVLHKGMGGLTPHQRGLLDLPVGEVPSSALPRLTLGEVVRTTGALWWTWWRGRRQKSLRRVW